MPIKVLAPAVAAGIAAGEVIERPASVVKELVENALDAGASTVDVTLHQGGLQAIRVTDNGHGIAADELEVAFQRHSTSKLETLEQLESLRTLGFRGEALATIAAAAHVRLVSRQTDSEVAAAIEIEGSEVIAQTSESAAPGTTVLAEALFSMIPARLKFIRSPSAETGRVHQAMDHLALASPEVRFSLKTDTKTLLQTSGNGSLRDVTASVYGADLAEAMLDVSPSSGGVYSAHGLVSPPDRSRANRTGISLFVNGRWITSRTLAFAIEEAYTGMLMEGRHPFAILFLDVSPSEVDVNVHPNKREVRFVRDGDVFSSIQRAVRETLLDTFPVAQARGLLAPAQGRAVPRITPRTFAFTLAPSTEAWAPLPQYQAELPIEQAPIEQPSDAMPTLRILGQISNSFIVAEGPDGMYLIDQHAAHESVLYYRLLKQWEKQRPEVQPMLVPMVVDLTPEQSEAAEDARETLERYGMVLEPFGDHTWLLRAVPAMSRSVDAAKLVAEVIERHRTAGSSGDGITGVETRQSVAASIACHSAVRAGQGLDQEEMEALTLALSTETNPQHCPHGRPTTIRVTTGMLEREFGR
jgi:DNA mismatch repair protein MutL